MKHRLSTYTTFSWQPIRNIGFTLGAALRRVVFLRDGGPTSNWIRTAMYFGRFVGALQRSQGWRGVVIHLKGCHVLLQQCVGGHILDNPRQLGTAISRSRTGLPRVIPIIHRRSILSGDVWAIKIWSSFFWLYRVIDIPGKLKLGTITRPFEVNYLIIMEWCGWLVQFLPVFLELVGFPKEGKDLSQKRRSLPLNGEETSLLLSLCGKSHEFVELLTALLLPSVESDLAKKIPRKEWKSLMRPILMNLQPRLLLLLNSGPNSAKGPGEGPGPDTRTSLGSILTDLFLWTRYPEYAPLRDNFARLWASANGFAKTAMAQATAVYQELDSLGFPYDHEYDTYLTPSSNEEGPPSNKPLLGFSANWGLGKLGFIPEPAGKIRVVAMVDSLTQMILRPLHDAVFEILRKIPQDGTFDQEAPAVLLGKQGVKHFWSYDLSAATDRFPVSLQQGLLSYLIGPRVARAWRLLLTERTFRVPRRISEKQRVPRGTPESVRYNAGQPMGAYTSWAVFALTHHLLVQFAAYQAGHGLKWFTLYALLGDDVVIAERSVAEKYLLLLQAIGVEVGLAKSLISERGVFEFAKRTFRVTDEGLLVNLSGISLDALGACITDPSVAESILEHTRVRGPKEGLIRIARVLGYGFRARSHVNGFLAGMNSRLLGLAILFTRPSALFGRPFSEWVRLVTIETVGVLSDERLSALMDSVRQRLLGTARRLAETRARALFEWKNPIDSEGKPLSNVLGVPHMVRTDSPKHSMFLAEWVFKPLIEIATRDYSELVSDLSLWEQGETSEGNFSLDEIYTSIDRLVRELQSVDTEVNLFVRRQTEESAKKRAKNRSAAVKLWKGCRRVVADTLAR